MSRYVSRLLAGVVLFASVVVPSGLVAAPAQAACHPVIRALTFAAPRVTGGTSTTATVRLSCRAPSRQKVRLRSAGGVHAPRWVYVAKGASSRGFTVATLATTTRATGTVTATYRRKSLRRGLTRLVTPCYPAPVPRSVVLSSTLRAGGRASGSVMLDCAARTPLTVSLDASSGRVSVPPVVRVPAGARTASFEVSARMPGSSEDAYDATIRATAGTRSVTGLLTVEPALRDLAIEQISGTDTATLVVGLTGRTRTAATVVLSADDAGTLDLPQEVTVPAGASAATVSVAISRHSWDAAVDVTATLGARAVTTSTSVDRYFQAGDSYVVDEPTLAPADENGGVRGVLHLTLDHPVGGEGLEVVDDRALRYDIPVGAESVDLPVYLTPYPVDSQVTATFTLLTGRGTVIDYRDVSFRVHPSVAAVSAPDPVVVGQPGTGRVSLIAASAVDETVVLSGAGLTVPDSVTVPAGETTATFPVSAPAAGTGSIRASVRGVATTSTPVAVGAAIPDECRPTAIEVPADVYASPDYDEPLLYPATVELGCTAPTELLVPLTVDDDTDRLYVGMPTFARVAAGESSGDFMLSVLGGGACGSFRCTPARDVVLSAGVGDLSLDRTVTIKPGLSTFRGEIDPATGRYALRIWMTGQAAGNTFVDISTDDPEILIFPARTAIPTGARSLLVPSVSDSIPDEGAVVGITVSIGPVVQHYLVGVHR